jgi:hypothetical protein
VDRWRESLLLNVPVNGEIMDDPFALPPGFDLKRRELVILHLTRQVGVFDARFAIVALLSRQQPILLIANSQ